MISVLHERPDETVVTAECQGCVDSFDTTLIRDRAASVRCHEYQAFIARQSLVRALPTSKREHNNRNNSQVGRSDGPASRELQETGP
jgi:hypothetical protein